MASGGDVMKNSTDKSITVKDNIFSTLSSRLPLLLTSVLLTSMLSACHFPKLRDSLASEPFGGTIVDEETGKPIPNAVVMMRWPIVTGTIAGSHGATGSIEVAESVTDAEGRYAIAGWFKGKEEISGAFVYKNDPKLVIFAPGYWPTKKFNDNYNFLPRGEAWKAEWDGEAIGLKPMHSEKWDYGQWREYLRSIESYLSVYFMPECPWLKIPNYYLARHRVVTKAYQIGFLYGNKREVNTTLSGSLTEYRSTLEKDCGVDPKAFFLSHGMTREEFDACCSGQPRTL